MSISVPVIAKVLMDLKLIRRDIGQITLAAGMTDDTIGWILLSVVSGLATSGTFNFATVLSSVGSAVFWRCLHPRTVMAQVCGGWTTISAGRRLVYRLCSYLRSAAALTHKLASKQPCAFVLGIRIALAAKRATLGNYNGWLYPIFFATAGLKVNLLQMLVPQTLMIGLLVLAVACFGKFTGLTSVPAQVA